MTQKAHTNAHDKAKIEYLLSDKVFCGNCGEAWVGESGYSATGAFYTYYKCRKAKVRKCKYKAISQEKLENQVYEMLMFKLFPNEEAIRAYVDFYVEKKSNDSYEQKQIAQYEKQLEPDSNDYDTDDKRAKLYYRHMRAVLKSPVLQKVYIYYGDDGNPDPKVKIGIDISKGSESSGNESAPSASNERITNSFDLESDRVTKIAS